MNSFTSYLLPYEVPYAYEPLLDFLAFRAIRGVEVVRDTSYWRTVAIESDFGWLSVQNDETAKALVLNLSPTLKQHAHILKARIETMFDTQCSPTTIAYALKSFHEDTDYAYERKGIRLPGAFDGFEMAVRAIIGQQITVKAANTLAGRLVERFGAPIECPVPGLERLFPTPEVLADPSAINAMGELGIIGRRAQAIQRMACALLEGVLTFSPDANPDEAYQRLIDMPGIGPWTAHYMLMRAYHHSDGFPVADFGVKTAFPGKKPREIEALSQRWRPYRAYAVMSIWCKPH